MFEKTDKIIQKVINQKGLGKIAQSSQICFEAEKIIAEMLPTLKNKIEIISFDKGVLKLSSSSPIVNQELHFKNASIKKALNKKLSDYLVKNIRCSIS